MGIAPMHSAMRIRFGVMVLLQISNNLFKPVDLFGGEFLPSEKSGEQFVGRAVIYFVD